MSNKNPQKNYELSFIAQEEGKESGSAKGAFKKMVPLLLLEKRGVITAFFATLTTSALNLTGPLVIGYTIDTYISRGNYDGVLQMGLLLLGIYAGAFVSNYIQMVIMGGVAQRVLWNLRNDLFLKLQELPLSFFNQNKSGDLISRINSDTEKVNEFFSQGLMRFAGNVFMIAGASIFIFSINFKLAAVSLIPAVVIVIFTKMVSGWVTKRNRKSLSEKGLLSAEIQESITNFKVILAFNRRDYFKKQFNVINERNYKASFNAEIANELFTPVFEFLGNVAMLMMLAYGLHLVSSGQFAIGLLVSFVIYITRFYDPLREMARLWATLQSALAAWDRIGVILNFTTDMEIAAEGKKDGAGVVEFRDVSFAYLDGKKVLEDINFVLEQGKTYALVGPTGGGKTTTASLIARLFDPTIGTVYLNGVDIRTYSPEVRTSQIGFILQEPYLFAGTIKENLMYGSDALVALSDEDFENVITQKGFDTLLSRFKDGLETRIVDTNNLSLGEKQMIAFMRAVLREPAILVLDEATANIDTVTENVLETIIKKLPSTTTKIIIAHRLNTIKDADTIFFVNGMSVTEAGSMEQAVEMILSGKRLS
jgi:ATP-binding cassette subfamily B protein